MGKDESEMVALKEEPGYGGTDAEESKIDISDFKPAAPTWVLDGSLRAKEHGLDARGGRVLLPVHPDVLAAVRRRAPALAAPDHRVRAALRRRVDERAGRRLGACSLQGVHKYKLSTLQGPCYGVVRAYRGQRRLVKF